MMISCKQVSVKINGKNILQNIDADISKGSFFGVLGPNGAGKTTLLRALAGIDQKFSGSIKIENQEITKLDRIDLAKKLCWIPEFSQVPFDFSALELTVLGRYPWHQGHPKQSDYDRASSALEEVNILEKSSQPVTSMSSGERRKIMLARAIASDAEIIILDEPLANLDIQAKVQNSKILKDLCHSGKTVIASMHDIALAEQLTSHCILMKNAATQAIGRTKDILTAELVSKVFEIDTEFVKNKKGISRLLIGT